MSPLLDSHSIFRIFDSAIESMNIHTPFKYIGKAENKLRKDAKALIENRRTDIVGRLLD